MIEFARYAKDGTVTAGPIEGRPEWDGIRPGMRFWAYVEAFVAAGGVIEPFTGPQVTVESVIAERDRRLASGFDFDFGGARGVHRIGTTPADMVGWNEVTTAAQAALNLGLGANSINIITDTGPVTVTALEWQSVLAAAAQHRQPIWAASFALQSMSPIPANFADDAYWT